MHAAAVFLESFLGGAGPMLLVLGAVGGLCEPNALAYSCIGSFGALAQFLYKLGGIVTMASTSEYYRKVLRLTTTQRVLYREGF